VRKFYKNLVHFDGAFGRTLQRLKYDARVRRQRAPSSGFGACTDPLPISAESFGQIALTNLDKFNSMRAKKSASVDFVGNFTLGGLAHN
jgi:hypothetical protein